MTGAAAVRQKRGLQGVNRLRRLLRRLPEDCKKELREAVAEGAELVRSTQVGLAPVDEGDLVRSIEVSFSSDGLAAVVGPAVSAIRADQRIKAANRRDRGRGVTGKINRELSAANAEKMFQAFKALWIEHGTKGSPERNIPPQPARPFIRPSADLNRAAISKRLKEAVDRALKRAAKGAGSSDA